MHTPKTIKQERDRLNKALSDLQQSCGDDVGHDFILLGAEVIPRRALNSGERPSFLMHFRCEHCGLELSSKVTRYAGEYVSNQNLGPCCDQILENFKKSAEEHAHLVLHPFQDGAGYGISVDFPEGLSQKDGKRWLKRAIEKVREGRRRDLAAKHAEELARV